jgi:hypothetical protein
MFWTFEMCNLAEKLRLLPKLPVRNNSVRLIENESK